MRVAIVMPEIGFAEVPMRPQIREDTVTNRNPKMTTSTAAAALWRMPSRAPGTG